MKWKDGRLELTQLLILLAVCIAAGCCSTVEHVAMKFTRRLEVELSLREATCPVIFAFSLSTLKAVFVQ